ncbi:hypothetical protein CC78DRAFT_577373 [Lojkania enalia]|uniref:Uncharacterized protein n=1 Tax=Lojkania enalia TaxID=147567 RepID=A0A9P4KDD8_9PLEO|nr:hypothetical protein CC78DRAFT_577373 [Didymosphaeria enalia]
MRSVVVFGLVAAASAARHNAMMGSQNGRDCSWSYLPDKTAAWYQTHGKPLPALAPDITVVEANKSYIVKLGCVGCPFRVRKYGELVETWSSVPQRNSLLLNFTISNIDSTLLLNGKRIAPMAPLPLSLYAYQTNANLSAGIMTKMAHMHMLDDATWIVGTKYGRFELQYEHTLLATESPVEEYLQFDVTAIHMRSTYNPGSAKLNNGEQKMVQLLLGRQFVEDQVNTVIKDIQLVTRQDREQPIKMPCGKTAMIQTEYNPLEWDYYGKFGTWSRAMHRLLWTLGSFLQHNAPFIIIFSIICKVIIVRRHINRRKAQAAELLGEEDTEAAVPLASEYGDAPPRYSEEAQDAVEKGQVKA